MKDTKILFDRNNLLNNNATKIRTENKIKKFRRNWYLINSSKGLTNSGVSKILGTKN